MNQKRYFLLDALRGFALINMILYHAMWDMDNIFHADMPWFDSGGAYIWQQFICHTFILLSGFCWSMGNKKLRRALIVTGASVIISVVTAAVMPESIILFGVLTLIGVSMLLMIPLDKLYQKLNPFFGLLIFALLFTLTKNISDGYLGVADWRIIEIPRGIYSGYFTSFLGFPFNGFYSSDYFPLIPWVLLFNCGYFLYHIFKRLDLFKYLSAFRIKPLEFLGRHSLVFYMIHQPVVYGVLFLAFRFI